MSMMLEAPTVSDLPKLLATLESSAIVGETPNRAVREIRFVLEGAGLIPPDPERPSEAAMRLANERRAKRNVVPPVKTLDEALAQARDVRFRDWSKANFWALMRALVEDYDWSVEKVAEKVRKAFAGREKELVQIINDGIDQWNPKSI